jgi:hypothetical protein
MRSRCCSGTEERCGSTRREDSAARVAGGCITVVGVTCRVAVLTVGVDGATPLATAAVGAASSSATVLTSDLAASDSAAIFGGPTIADMSAAAAEFATIGIFAMAVAVAALGCVRAPTRPVAARRRVAAADLVAVVFAIAASGRDGVDLTLDLAASVAERSGVARRRSSSALKIVNASRRRSASREDAGGAPESERLGGRIVRDHHRSRARCNPPLHGVGNPVSEAHSGRFGERARRGDDRA